MKPMGLSVDIHNRRGDSGDVAIIRCEGELDIATAAKLIDAFDRVCVQQPKEVQVDLRCVEFMDSAGLGCLTHGALAFRKHGTGFKVLPSEPVRDLINTVGPKALLNGFADGSDPGLKGSSAPAGC